MASPPPAPIGAPSIPIGTLIKSRWKVIRKIGQGAFGEIYAARNIVTSELVAIKVERADSKKQVLKLEVAVLKKLQSCPLVVCFITCGRHNEFNFMVMELLGESISEMRRRQLTGKFSMLTTLKLGMQMLKAIESVHELGYLHRDIKPSNFALGLSAQKRNTCYLIDFGLSRRYVMPNGEIRPSREQSGFRGTARYASLASHQGKDLGRMDDLWSLFYVLIEFASGTLPWRKLKDKDQVGEMKEKISVEDLCKELPKEFFLFAEHLNALKFGDRPNYSYIHNLIFALFTRLTGDDNTSFDWEKVPMRAQHRPRPLPSLATLATLVLVANLEKHPTMKLVPLVKSRLLPLLLRQLQGRILPATLIRLLDPSTQALDLSSADVTDADYGPIAQICHDLRSLTLGGTSDVVLKQLLASNTRLEQLTVHCSKSFSSKAVRFVADLEQLTVLRLKLGEKLSDSNLEVVLDKATNLQELSLYGCRRIKGEMLKVLVKSKRKHIALKNLNLSGCEISRKGFKQLIKLAPNLTSMSLAPFFVSFKLLPEDLRSIFDAASSLTSLELRSNHLDMDPILIDLAKRCTSLARLSVDGIGVSDNGIQAVLAACIKLESLLCSYGEGVTEVSLHHIARSCLSLKSLTLEYTAKRGQRRLSTSEHAMRAILLGCTQLAELNLPRTELSGACFTDASYFSSLTALNVAECTQLNDVTLRSVAECCPQLRRLDLSGLNHLSEALLPLFANYCPALEELSLLNCAFYSDSCLRALLKSMPQLFVKVTRYLDADLRGLEREVCDVTADKAMQMYPNTHREEAKNRALKRTGF